MTSQDGATALQLDRDHVFHSWSAQAHLDPLAIAGGLGSTVWDHDGRRVPRLLEPAGQRQHRPPAPAGGRGDPGAGGDADDDRAGDGQPHARAGGASDPRPTRPTGSRPSSSPTAAPTPTRTRSGWRACTPDATRCVSAYRSYHGNTGAAVVATGDWRRVPNEYARGHVHHFGPFLYRSEFWATTPEQESERALHHLERVIQAEGPASDRGDPAGDDPRHGRRPGAAARVPRGRARDRRPVRDPADPRRGHVRVRPHRQLVRVRRLRRAARPDHLRQGRQLRLRARPAA